jgi:hypothetical protein
MKSRIKATLAVSAALLVAGCMVGPQSKYTESPMTFFVTSVGLGKGADLGGLRGADEHCTMLAQGAGVYGRTWRAYLSTTAAGGATPIHARERIGVGPWYNAKGVLIARDLTELHTSPNITKETALTERGQVVAGRGDKPNRHDILTGSNPDGRAVWGRDDMTCGNWTQSGAGAAMVGHHDRLGLTDDAPSRSWNSSHPSRGCSQENLRASGGDGLIYCFAENVQHRVRIPRTN